MRNEFELYGSMPGWEDAHAAIDSGVTRICSEMIAEIQAGKLISRALTDANSKCWAVLKPYRDFGALDSEPRYKCERRLKKALEAAQYSMPDNYCF